VRWIIGDIHGMLRPLRALLDAIVARDKAPRFYFVGDYVNRGPNSRGVIDLLIGLDDARFVRGNHDDVFDAVLHGTSYTGEPTGEHRIAAFQWFMQHGLDTTFQSYGVTDEQLEDAVRRPSVPALEKLAELVPEHHRLFIRELPPTIEDPDLFVAHAKWDPELPADSIAARAGSSDKLSYNLVWGRFTAAEIDRKKRWRARGFFGHTPVSNYAKDEDDEEAVLPIIHDDIVLLDTGAVLTIEGRLTAVCAETSEYIQADRAGKLVTPNGKGGK
jgi:serine/threonine protein phosphatase 1